MMVAIIGAPTLKAWAPRLAAAKVQDGGRMQ